MPHVLNCIFPSEVFSSLVVSELTKSTALSIVSSSVLDFLARQQASQEINCANLLV